MFIKETPATIFTWNQETFGSTTTTIANRTILEIAEFYMAVLNDDAKAIVSELADVAIMLWSVAAGNNLKVKLKPSITHAVINSDEDKTNLTKAYARLICIDYTSYLYNMDNEENNNDLLLFNVIDYVNSIAYIWNIYLPNIVDDKMIINRSRTWKKVGKDNFRHV